MSSLGEVQRIIGLSLSKIQTGRNQRGGLPLHKNLLVATVLNKARDIYMQETMYMNYRLMACGQFGREEHDEVEEEDAPDPEDYDEDSESDVEDDAVPAGPRDYVKDALIATANNVGASSAAVPLPPEACIAADGCTPQAATLTLQLSATSQADLLDKVAEDQAQQTLISDEGFIDESDCECDARNFGDDGESRVPFQYCFNCAPFHPSNGRGPTLVSPHHQNAAGSILAGSSTGPQEQEDKLIYDMDLKSTRNQPAEEGGGGGGSNVKRKRQISREEGDEASSSLVPKRRRDVCNTCDVESANLDDSGYQGESDEVFHPAFRGSIQNGNMEVDQITSLVSIFSFGQKLMRDSTQEVSASLGAQAEKSSPDEEDSDSDSDTSSDSGHSSDDLEHNNDDKCEDAPPTDLSGLAQRANTDKPCSSQAKDVKMEVMPLSPEVAAAV